MPRFSSSLISPASEYRAGGRVLFSAESIFKSRREWPAESSGKMTPSLADCGSALSQPSKMIREPLSQKSGKDLEVKPPSGGFTSKLMVATTLVRITFADFIWLEDRKSVV